MKAVWNIMLAALAGLALSACAPAEGPPLCGGVTDRTDRTAPKSIASREITELRASFWMEDGGRGARWDIRASRDGSGGVSVTLGGGMQGQASAGAALFDDVQEVIDRFALAKSNGIDRVIAGLPPQFSPSRLEVGYASGERLYFQKNGDPDAGWPKAMLDIFLTPFKGH